MLAQSEVEDSVKAISEAQISVKWAPQKKAALHLSPSISSSFSSFSVSSSSFRWTCARRFRRLRPRRSLSSGMHPSEQLKHPRRICH